MTIEVVPLGRCQRQNRWQNFHWLDASQGVRTVAAVAAVGYSAASPLIADEHDPHAEAKENCTGIEAGQMEERGEFGFEQQVQVLEARRTVQRMDEH